jgi:hypothetical protein
MKKIITALAGTGLLTLTLGLVGCGQETATEKKEGGMTNKMEPKQTGNTPPPAGTTTPAPPKH